MKDNPPLCILYTWGYYQKHRDWIHSRTRAAEEEISPKVRVMMSNTFEFAAPIFVTNIWPGSYLERLPYN